MPTVFVPATGVSPARWATNSSNSSASPGVKPSSRVEGSPLVRSINKVWHVDVLAPVKLASAPTESARELVIGSATTKMVIASAISPNGDWTPDRGSPEPQQPRIHGRGTFCCCVTLLRTRCGSGELRSVDTSAARVCRRRKRLKQPDKSNILETVAMCAEAGVFIGTYFFPRDSRVLVAVQANTRTALSLITSHLLFVSIPGIFGWNSADSPIFRIVVTTAKRFPRTVRPNCAIIGFDA